MFLQYCALIFQSNRIGSQPTTTTPFAEAPLPIYGAPSQPFRTGRNQPFRAGFGTRNRSGRIVKVLRRRKRKLNKDSGNKLESDSKKPEEGDGDHEVVSAAAKFAQAVDVVTLNLREENESNSAKEERVMCWGRGGSSRCPSISIGVVRNTYRDDPFDKLRNPFVKS